MQEDPDRARPARTSFGASQVLAGVARWMLVLTFANTGHRVSHFCPCLPAASPRLISSSTLLPTSHFSLSWPCLASSGPLRHFSFVALSLLLHRDTFSLLLIPIHHPSTTWHNGRDRGREVRGPDQDWYALPSVFRSSVLC